ncbi:MAG: hypothetical protein AUG49_19310 [Catenulispora sp. 13_1_20CM_3_70_7]|nr:MAG: hypothetical protein AUG49_19310 [Catenulispora sp. 13_1_20CM_3_70_7]
MMPPSAQADARNRAVRTFLQGLGIDVAAGVVLAVGPALADAHFAWTGPYWATLGALAAKTAVQTAVAYVASKVLPARP